MAALPTPIDTKQIETKHQPILGSFAMRLSSVEARIQRLGITSTIAAELHEIDTDAKRALEAFNAEVAPEKKRRFDSHRWFTSFCEKFTSGATNTRAKCSTYLNAYDLEQARIAEEKLRAAEEAARAEAERQRQAEVSARLAEAAAAERDGKPEMAAHVLQEAQEVAEAPLVPVSVPEVARTKVEGRSTTFKLVGTVRNGAKYVCELLGVEFTPAIAARSNLLIEVIGSWSQSGINAQLKRGLTFSEDAMRVERQPIGRNLSGR